MNKLISIDLHADFGCLKKPDTNDPVYLTFNMLHKPSLLGIFGAIVGLDGFSQPPPKSKKKGRQLDDHEHQKTVAPYYEALKELKVSVRPIQKENGVCNPSFNGNFSKTTLTYNNSVGYANVQEKGPTTLMVTEQVLINPIYRCYVLFDKDNEIYQRLFNNLKNYETEYLPYLGKNEFSVWWDNWKEYGFEKFEPGEQPFRINSIFIKEQLVTKSKVRQPYKIAGNTSFMLFENLPIGYDEELMQYEYRPFAYTDFLLSQEYQIGQLYQLTDVEPNEIIQLF
jgi:hypothetical protein